MSVGIDEAGEYDGIFELRGRNTMGSRNCRIGTNGLEASVQPNQNGATLDGGTFYGNHPLGGQTPRPHVRDADWALGRLPPLLLRCRRWLRSPLRGPGPENQPPERWETHPCPEQHRVHSLP